MYEHQPLLVTDVIRRLAEHQPDKVAVIDEAGSVTYSELWQAVLAVSGGLAKAGVHEGDRVATALPPSLPHLVILLASMLRGAVACTLNIRLTHAEFERFLAPIGATLIVCDAEHAPQVRRLAAKVLELVEVHASIPLPARLAKLWSKEPAAPPLREDAAALIIPTGGTTGIPKGAIFTHRAIWLWGASVSMNYGRMFTDTELMVAPFFHVSVITGPMTTLFTGGTVRILRSFSTPLALDAIDRGATMMQAAVTIYSKLRQDPAFSSVSRARMRLCSFGSMPATPEFIENMRADYPNARLRLTYGATEFSLVSVLQHEHIVEGDLVSVGYPLPGVGIRIIDDDGAELPQGTAGEIEVRCPWQTLGYWGLPEETRSTYSRSGIRLGDIGYFDARRRLVVSGRKKEMLISGGENVFPREVETVLARHPAVAEIVVYGAQDAYWGDRIEAAVVPKPGCSVTRDELVAFGRAELGGYKLPKAIVVVEAIPVTPNNKPDRRKLRDLAAQRVAG